MHPLRAALKTTMRSARRSRSRATWCSAPHTRRTSSRTPGARPSTSPFRCSGGVRRPSRPSTCMPTPFAPAGDMPGVEIHANALETLVRGNPIREVPQAVSTALAVVAGLLGAALVIRLHAFRALIAAAGLWVILTLAAYAGFVLMDVWMRGMAGTWALVLGYGGTVVEHFVREQRERRRFQQFFSPAVAREVVRHKEEGSLDTSRR